MTATLSKEKRMMKLWGKNQIQRRSKGEHFHHLKQKLELARDGGALDKADVGEGCSAEDCEGGALVNVLAGELSVDNVLLVHEVLVPLDEAVDPGSVLAELLGNVLEDAEAVGDVVLDNAVLKVWRDAALDLLDGRLGHRVCLVGGHDCLEIRLVGDLVAVLRDDALAEGLDGLEVELGGKETEGGLDGLELAVEPLEGLCGGVVKVAVEPGDFRLGDWGAVPVLEDAPVACRVDNLVCRVRTIAAKSERRTILTRMMASRAVRSQVKLTRWHATPV